ncbi:unnamed protein product [Bursaphelenchus xylophilus]|uniref:(pine wood nematode) hypothetical protein n=1 Tax=Bursaphelenchus xylophilus TaxID=6326 RepID=A0A7I8WZ60_BURXY|nr:unnamed protein product [Bursaphelenchus xylophilus]CAG9102461.1 unnamed protein product [Bursaphelenchus xylophilus]
MVSHKTISKKAVKSSKPSLKAKASSSWCEYMLWNISPALNETTGLTRTKMLMTLRTISKKLGTTIKKMHKVENVDVQFGCNMAIGCKLNESTGKYMNYEASSLNMFNTAVKSVFDSETPSVSTITRKDQRLENEDENAAVAFCEEYFKSARYSLEVQPSFNPTASQVYAKIFEKVKGRLTNVKCQLEDIRHLEGAALKKIIINEQRSSQQYYAPVLAANATEMIGLSLETFRDSGYAPNPAVTKLSCRFAMDNMSYYHGIYKNLASTFPNLETVTLETNVISLPSGEEMETVQIVDTLQPIVETIRQISEAATVKTAVKLEIALDDNELQMQKLLRDFFTFKFEKLGFENDDYLSFKSDFFSVDIKVLC